MNESDYVEKAKDVIDESAVKTKTFVVSNKIKIFLIIFFVALLAYCTFKLYDNWSKSKIDKLDVKIEEKQHVKDSIEKVIKLNSEDIERLKKELLISKKESYDLEQIIKSQKQTNEHIDQNVGAKDVSYSFGIVSDYFDHVRANDQANNAK